MTAPVPPAPDAEALRAALPPALGERVWPLSRGPAAGTFVLVWLRTALRAHDNPVLDVALAAADALGLPVFVYQGLSERYPYASDRHHSFILEGARDLHADLAARGLGSALHVERPGHRGPHLATLAAAAALVLADDTPVPPLTDWTLRLRDAVETPLWVVDAACVLPMRLPAPVDRAFRFREATAAARMRRLDAGWQDRPVARPGFVPPLPFTPVDLDQQSIPELVAACEIDHGIGPVPHTRGGTRAGQARWAAFRDGGGLAAYARTRNDAHRDGVSRMSAFIHYGMVSPFALARDAADHGSPGAAKWCDEFLIWRELAHAWCARQPALHQLGVLPGWAQATLDRHRGDPRPAAHSWETLARGQTGDRLWDAAQRSLLRHGELHNNTRMTWGKQLVAWAPDPETARALLVDLNHRFALDGRDPCSYGGLYWCLGLFDRPFSPEQPVIGSLRPRSTAAQARRLPLDRVVARLQRPPVAPLPRVAVVGAGIAGLRCARILHDHGLSVTVFDKSRGPSGRTATRRQPGILQADHGAQFFTAQGPGLRRHVESWLADGVVAPWEGRFGTLGDGGFVADAPRQGWQRRFVGAPRMSALGRHLSRGLALRTGCRVVAVEGGPGAFSLVAEDGPVDGVFDMVLVCVPAPQAVPLLALRPALAARAAAIEMLPCVAVMARFAPAPGLAFDGARVAAGPLAWVACDTSKPGRPGGPGAGETWVLHARPEHAAARIDHQPLDETGHELLAAFAALTGAPPPIAHTVHRWRYARPAADKTPGSAPGPAALFDGGIGLAGDGLVGPRVEAAWDSGTALAGRVLGAVAAAARRRDPAGEAPAPAAPAPRQARLW